MLLCRLAIALLLLRASLRKTKEIPPRLLEDQIRCRCPSSFPIHGHTEGVRARASEGACATSSPLTTYSLFAACFTCLVRVSRLGLHRANATMDCSVPSQFCPPVLTLLGHFQRVRPHAVSPISSFLSPCRHASLSLPTHRHHVLFVLPLLSGFSFFVAALATDPPSTPQTPL